MIVATGRLTFALPGNDSLKGKRKVVRRAIDRAKHRFNAAVAEVEDMDDHRRATLGVAVVSNDASHANAMLDRALDFLGEASEQPIISRTTELVHLGAADSGEPDLDDWEAT